MQVNKMDSNHSVPQATKTDGMTSIIKFGEGMVTKIQNT